MRFIFATDLHGDKQDSKTVKSLLDFTEAFKPHVRIFGGDLFDLRAIRRGASAEEQAESMMVDWQDGCQFLREWKPKYVLEGNHDQRLYHLAESNNGLKADYASKGIEELRKLYSKLNISSFRYHKRNGVLQLGKVRFLHGYHHGLNACRQHAQIYGSCIFGHVHTADTVTSPGLERRIAMSSGALCQLDMDYNSSFTSTLRHSNGWIYGNINEKTGEWQAWHALKEGGKFHLPTGFRDF